MKPCDTCPDIPCAHGGQCNGRVYWDGKPEKAKPLAQIQDCKWVEKCRMWYRREGKWLDR